MLLPLTVRKPHVLRGKDLPELSYAGQVPFDLRCIEPVRNNWTNKPDGGLWLSPLSPDGVRTVWQEWCAKIGMPGLCGEVATRVEVRHDSRFLIIDSYRDLAVAAERWGRHDTFGFSDDTVLFDFEKLSQSFDGVYLTAKGEVETRFSKPHLYGWDFESVLVLNDTVLTG